MLPIDQSHGLKYLITLFDNHKWAFQYKKRQQIRDCLQNLYEIDSLLKKMQQESPVAVKTINYKDPKIGEYFTAATTRIMQKIIGLFGSASLNHYTTKPSLAKISLFFFKPLL